MNWLANPYKSIVSLICLSLLITSCKKEGDFNLGGNDGSNVGMTFTDTLTLLNETILLNDSIISAEPAYLSFGGYTDPGATGITFAEAYTTLSLLQENKDYSGATIDSAVLYMNYYYAYGDTLAGQDFAVHQIATQLDGSVPYQPTTSFITYDPTIIGSIDNFKGIPSSAKNIRIPLTSSFASSLLSSADDRSNVDFNSNFYGIVIKANNNSAKNVVRANFTFVDYINALTPYTRLTVYFKRGAVGDSSVFLLTQYTPSFNKVITDRSATPLSSLISNNDRISASALNNKCYIQAGSGVVTKVTMPNLLNFKTIDGASVIINKATLIIPLDETSQANKYGTVSDVGLLELNPDNTYKYRNGYVSYIQSNTPNNSGNYYNQVWGLSAITGVDYRFDITRYVQFLVNGQYTNDGFIINPYQNSFYVNRAVLNGSNAVKDKMRLEIYYTKVK
ncbi:DUF4270 family protein [uncultured Cytophaga sp.]|uniref:DUF4270 family protein n=1 Tax=uncultured Cytophaga sp. TaxID=160238 RepID=UPI00263818A9|nr:DUF4270 family protein [uncultured Cytophaga sp.]